MANGANREPGKTVNPASLRELVPAELRELRTFAIEWAEREDGEAVARWVDEQERRHLARKAGY